MNNNINETNEQSGMIDITQNTSVESTEGSIASENASCYQENGTADTENAVNITLKVFDATGATTNEASDTADITRDASNVTHASFDTTHNAVDIMQTPSNTTSAESGTSHDVVDITQTPSSTTSAESGTSHDKVDITQPTSTALPETFAKTDNTDGALDKQKSEKGSGLFFKIVIPALIVTAGAIAALIFILLIPSNRAARLVEKGNRLFVEERFEAAADKYLQAAELQKFRIDAWYRAVVCAQNSAELDETELFSQARTAVNKMIFEQMTEDDRATVADLYLLTPEIIADGQERVDILLEGYKLLNEDRGLRPAIADAYLHCISEETESTKRSYLFEEALFYSDNAESILEPAIPCFMDAVIVYAEQDNFGDAYRLLDTYGKYMDEGGDDLRALVDDKKTLYDVKEKLLSSVYEAMSDYFDQRKEVFASEGRPETEEMNFGMFSKDWESMLRIDGSENAEFLAHHGEEYFLWAPGGVDKLYTGKACGLYVHDTGYYFFMGEYEQGKRAGFGVSFAKVGETSFYGFEGMYKEDAPNGEGIYYKSSNYAYTSLVEYKSVIMGKYKDGTEDGRMTVWAVTGENPGAVFAGEYTASAGFAPAATSLIETYGIEVSDDRTLISVLYDSSYGYGYYMPYYQTKGVAMSALGY